MGGAAPAGLRIGEVARRTGVSVATLRAWEARYGLLRPARTAGGQRLYSDADIARIGRVTQLLDEGWLVSAAAAELAPQGDQVAEGPSGRGERGHGRTPLSLERGAGLEALDPGAALLAYEALRAILHARRPREVRDALVELVSRLGGSVGPAAVQDAEVIPVDLSFGEGPPLLPRAPANTLTRLRLEAVLPALVEDARSLLELLHLSRRASEPEP